MILLIYIETYFFFEHVNNKEQINVKLPVNRNTYFFYEFGNYWNFPLVIDMVNIYIVFLVISAARPVLGEHLDFPIAETFKNFI